MTRAVCEDGDRLAESFRQPGCGRRLGFERRLATTAEAGLDRAGGFGFAAELPSPKQAGGCRRWNVQIEYVSRV